MKPEDWKVLHHLVQHYRMSTVLRALAVIAKNKSLEPREERDDPATDSDRTKYRKYADHWERTHTQLKRIASRLNRQLKGTKYDG